MRRTRLIAVVAGLCLLASVVTGCQRGKVGSKCRTTDWGDDGGSWVLRCQHGRWRRAMTKQQAATFVLALIEAERPPKPAGWALDSVTVEPDHRLRVRGWFFAGDRLHPSVYTPHITVNGERVAGQHPGLPGVILTGLVPIDRPDVHAALGLDTDWVGFDQIVESSELQNRVCLRGDADFTERDLACADVAVSSRSASGVPNYGLDTPTAAAGTIQVSGWGLVSHAAAPIDVGLSLSRYLDPVNLGATEPVAALTVVAAEPRSDLSWQYPAAGAEHGFSASWAAAPGRYLVCIDNQNLGAGVAALAGLNRVLPGSRLQPCQQVSVG